MTTSWGRPTAGDTEQRNSPIPDAGTPVVLNETTALLRSILQELKESHSLGERPTRGQFNLSPDSAQTPNGRILMGAPRLRLEHLIILPVSNLTFTLAIGGTNEYLFPNMPSGVNPLVLPIAIVLERGSSMQLLCNAATWIAWAIGYAE